MVMRVPVVDVGKMVVPVYQQRVFMHMGVGFAGCPRAIVVVLMAKQCGGCDGEENVAVHGPIVLLRARMRGNLVCGLHHRANMELMRPDTAQCQSVPLPWLPWFPWLPWGG